MAKRNASMIYQSQGGRISFGLLRELAECALVHGAGTVALGGRQEIILNGIVPDAHRHVRHIIGSRLAEHQPRRPNIVTTRAVCARAHRTGWLSEGSYDTVLEKFRSAPLLAIDIVDPQQDYVPLFCGDVHFLATPEPDFWMVYLNEGNQPNRVSISRPIHSADIADVVSLIQEIHVEHNDFNLPLLQTRLEERFGDRLKAHDVATPPFPTQTRPLVGFVLDPKNDTYSLGISVQLRSLSSAFLVDLSLLADRFGLATAHISTWKSLLLHGIPRTERIAFEKLLLRHRIDLFPGAWSQVCVNQWAHSALAPYARKLIGTLNETIPHVGSLGISLVTADKRAFPDTPIIVHAEPARGALSFLRPRYRFSLFGREDFGRHSPTLLSYGRNITASALAEQVIALIDRYSESEGAYRSTAGNRKRPTRTLHAHRCVSCGTEYSELYGDPISNVSAGTPFIELPDAWCCPTCEAPRSAFAASVREVA